MSVPLREPLTVDEQVDTYPRLANSGVTDSDVAERASDSPFPYYIAPHLLAQRVLGEGGTAIVFEALHTRLKVRVAVKMLKVSGPGASEARERLQREAELCARIDNPRIPRIYDVDSLPDGTPYVVMEEVHGRPLDEVLRHGPLDVDVACAITCEVLEALGELHSARIVHRDIKPSNLILEENSGNAMRVRVLDLGIAKPLGPHHALGNAAHLTQSGMLLGTPHYMANEQLLGGAVDERTDLYAVGVMLYETLAGRPPFTGDSVSQVIAAALRDEPVPLDALRADIPARLQEIVERAMQRDADLRYPSARDMLDALRAFQAGQDAPAKQAAMLPPPASVAPALLSVISWPEEVSHETDNAQWASRALHSLPPTGLPARRTNRVRVWAGITLAALGAAVAIAWPAELDEHTLTPVPSTSSSSSTTLPASSTAVPAQQLPFTEPPRATDALKLEVPAQLAVDPDLVLPPLVPLMPLAETETPRETADERARTPKTRRNRSLRVTARNAEPVRSVPLNPYLQRLDATLRPPKPLEAPPEGVPGNPYGDDYVPSNPYAEN